MPNLTEPAGLAEPMLPAAELERMERAVRRMLDTGRAEGVEIIGLGELSCVVARQGLACKRLPPFGQRARYDAYAHLVDGYLRALRAAGVAVVETAAQVVEVDGEHVGWIVQRRVPADTLLNARLRAAPDDLARHLPSILDHVDACAAAGLGFDAQLSNWSVEDGRPLLLDVTTPLMRDARGRDLLDTELFLAMLPALIRGLVRRFMLGDILDRYFDRRGVLLDIVGNLPDYGLERLTADALARVNARLDAPITAREVKSYRREQWWTWRVIRRALEAEYFWRRRVLRRRVLNLPPTVHARVAAGA